MEAPNPAPDYSPIWNAKDDEGREVAAGVQIGRAVIAK